MLAVRAGDDEGFALLVERYKDRLVNYLTQLTGNRDLGEEYAQEAFVKLYLHADRYREEGRLAPYLFRIATNLVRSAHRRNRRWIHLVPRLSLPEPSPPSPQQQAIEIEITGVVRSAIAELPLHLRAPLLLREIEGWSYEQISESLGCRQGTVKSRISRGREQLRKRLTPYWKGALRHA